MKERNVSTWTWASSAIRSAYFISITFMGAIGSLNCAIQIFRKGSHRTKNFSKIKNSFRSSKTAVSTVIADLQRPKQNKRTTNKQFKERWAHKGSTQLCTWREKERNRLWNKNVFKKIIAESKVQRERERERERLY
jgi:hypothetical protein